ncbi:MAG TPA: hypothetical protein VGL53_03175 [Bryobacteraceae bacterium]
MNTIFHLNWLRESASSHLEADLGTSVRADQLEVAIVGLLPEQQPGRAWGPVKFSDIAHPERLPQWARRRVTNFFGADPSQQALTVVEGFCNRIRDNAWNVAETDLFLPYFNRREWSMRFSRFPEIGFTRTAHGLVAEGVQPYSIQEIALRTAAAAFTRTQPKSGIHFRIDNPLIAPWRTLLLERYGIEMPADAPALESLTVDAPGSLLEAWQNTPRERHCHYYSVFSRLALAVQNSLRRWTLAAFVVGADELANFEASGDVIVYAATRPHAEKKANDFSYDVLDAELMNFAFSRASRRLEPLLKTASDELLALGRHEDARQFVRRDVRLYAPRLADRARRRHRVRAMLVSEGVLIYSMIRFANRLKSFDTARSVTVAAEDLARDFVDRTRRLFFFAPNPEEFGTILFLEASNAIATAMGAEQSLDVACSTIDGGHYRSLRKMAESPMPI